MSPARRRRPLISERPSHVSGFVRSRAKLEQQEPQRVREVLAARGLSPRRRFGQNFLVRPELAMRIVEHAHIREDDVVLEIGPGAGALTGHLASRARHVIAIEKGVHAGERVAQNGSASELRDGLLVE